MAGFLQAREKEITKKKLIKTKRPLASGPTFRLALAVHGRGEWWRARVPAAPAAG
jgi:hypothetical protein